MAGGEAGLAGGEAGLAGSEPGWQAVFRRKLASEGGSAELLAVQ